MILRHVGPPSAGPITRHFILLNAFLSAWDFTGPRRTITPVLQRRLQSSGDSDLAFVGTQLGSLHHERVQADYHLDNHWAEQKDTALMAVQKAAAMIAVLEACPIHSDRWKNIRADIAKANITGTDNLVDLTSTP